MRRSRFRGVVFLAALLALEGQLAFGACPPQPVLARIAFGGLCQSGAGSHPFAPAHPEHHVPLGAASPLCLAQLLLPVPPLASAPLLPLPSARVSYSHLLLPAPAPSPPAAPRAAPPRGPPSLA